MTTREAPIRNLIDVARHTTASEARHGADGRFEWNPDGRQLALAIWIEHRWLCTIYVMHLVVGVTLDLAGVLPVRSTRLWNGTEAARLIVVACCWLPVLILFDIVRRRSWTVIQRRYITARAIAGMLIVSFFVAQEAQLHTAFKRTIGVTNPFRFDATLRTTDTWLHLGRPAWRWLDPVFHPVGMTAALDMAYWLWFPLMIGAGCWLAWLPVRRLRTKALLAWAMLWVLLGTMLAQICASAGPAFYRYVVEGADPYAPLLAHLDTVNAVQPLMAVHLQAQLWANHVMPGYPWSAISAMPSMHLAIPTLFAIVLFKLWRPAGLFAAAYVVVILLGSIYLGWHYAIDGYVSIIAVVLIWKLAGVILANSKDIENLVPQAGTSTQNQ